MNNKMFNMLSGMDDDVNKIVRSSSKAVCGNFEREKVVKDSEVARTKSLLKKAGFIIIGTGPAGFGRTKVWFNPAGVNL